MNTVRGPWMRSYGPRGVGVLMLMLTMIALPGCSMVNPYLKIDGKTLKSVQGKQIDVDQALTYANEVKKQYRTAIGSEATFNRLIGVGLIGTATALPIMGINEVSTQSISIAGMYGAGAFGLNAWLQSAPRQRSYIQGYNAVNCAIEVVRPLAFDTEQASYKSFTEAVNGIDSKITDLDWAIRGTSSDDETARQVLESARTTLSNAQTARLKGIDVQNRINAAGSRLVSAVDRIVGEVDMAVQSNASDLSTLSGIIGGLGGIYGEFPGASPISAFSAPSTEQLSARQERREGTPPNIVHATVVAASKTRIISDFISSLPAALPVETLKACRVDLETITTAMSVQPSSTSFSGTENQTKAFLIRGGVFPYIVTLMGTDSDLIDVRQSASFGPSFTITVKPNAPAGHYVIHVTDGSQRTTSLPLEVVGAPPG